jgi:hypothetical protein
MKTLLAVLALCVVAADADAAVVTWTSSLSPLNEVPPVLDSTGSGMAHGELDTISNVLSWSLSWTGLTGQPAAAHFHGPAPVGVNAGVLVNIGNISGLNSPSVGSVVVSEDVEAALLGGLLYINVHTQSFPGGEIRGQVAPVPLPASAALLLGAFGAAGLALRRRG